MYHRCLGLKQYFDFEDPLSELLLVVVSDDFLISQEHEELKISKTTLWEIHSAAVQCEASKNREGTS